MTAGAGGSVHHDGFVIERTYDAPVDQVFRAWSDPDLKVRWFAPDTEQHTLDFRVGGTERNQGGGDPNGPRLSFESRYHDIVENVRIVLSSELSADGTLVTVSLTTVTFHAAGDATRQVLTQHSVFLDGRERPEWRFDGTSDQLDRLAAVAVDPATSGSG